MSYASDALFAMGQAARLREQRDALEDGIDELVAYYEDQLRQDQELIGSLFRDIRDHTRTCKCPPREDR